jgi:hypothetical protein
VGLVLDQQDRTSGQVAELLVQVGQDLVAVGVASCDQAGRDLTDTAVQGPQADGWGGPSCCHSLGMVQARGPVSNRRIRWGSLGLPSRGRLLRGRSASPGGAVLLVAVDPAAHGRGVVAEQAGDLGGQADQPRDDADPGEPAAPLSLPPRRRGWR